jgi:hypothetical protein
MLTRTRLFYTVFVLHEHATHLTTEEVHVPREVIDYITRLLYDRLFVLTWQNYAFFGKPRRLLHLDLGHNYRLTKMSNEKTIRVDYSSLSVVVDDWRVVAVPYELLHYIDTLKRCTHQSSTWRLSSERLIKGLQHHFI